MRRNYAYGFDRMHTWLALAHAQIPVDIVSEKQVEEGMLAGYAVCYLSGPNLTRRAAEILARWVRDGGVLWMTAAAGERDEYNRPMDVLDSILPARRGENQELGVFREYGSALWNHRPRGTVRVAAASMELLLAKQPLEPGDGTTVLGWFDDDAPAVVEGTADKGRVYCVGFLPGLSYARPAIMKRRALVAARERAGADDNPAFAYLDRSYNPWEFPADIREEILRPVRAAAVKPPIVCGTPLIDAVYMTCPTGVLIPLSNYTLADQTNVTFSVRVPRRIRIVESVHHGNLTFEQTDDRIAFVLPGLASTDFLKLHF